MAEISEDPKFTLRLLIDEEKNKVVLAETGKDFVDVLFSFLTLPMGTIVRLTEKHQKSDSVTIGCIHNLYRSVVDMEIDDFETETCQQILLYPRSVKEIQCKRLKLNINPVDGLKYFKCHLFAACNLCSNFSCSECVCGGLMHLEIELSEKVQVAGSIQNDVKGVFVKGRSSFIITDDLLVSVGSIGLVLKTIDRLGCSDILTLLGYIFSSNTPLTNTFLKKQGPHDVNNIHKLLSLSVKVKTYEAEPKFTLDAIVRKQDMKILYVECGEDFVDLLFTFLAVPLEFLCDINLGCIRNLHRSFKDLSVDTTSKCVLPYYYKCQKQLPDITTEEPPHYYRYENYNPRQPGYSLTTDHDRTLFYRKERLVPVTLIDPKPRGKDQSENGSGFVKRGTKFRVTDDLIITPRNSLSTFICLLKKVQIQADDLEVQAMSLMRVSMLTSSALNSVLWNLIAKKTKEET